MSKAYDAISIKKRRERAHQEIADVCSGKHEWRMSIPFDAFYDSDAILTDALDDIDYLLAESGQRLKRIAELEARVKYLEEAYENDASGGTSRGHITHGAADRWG